MGGFLQMLQDYGDIWDELEAGQRVRATFELQRELEALHKSGFWVFGTQVVRPYKMNAAGREEVIRFRTVVIRVVRDHDPTIIKATKGTPNIYRRA